MKDSVLLTKEKPHADNDHHPSGFSRERRVRGAGPQHRELEILRAVDGPSLDPRVGSGSLQHLAGRVGSGRVGSGRVGSGSSQILTDGVGLPLTLLVLQFLLGNKPLKLEVVYPQNETRVLKREPTRPYLAREV